MKLEKIVSLFLIMVLIVISMYKPVLTYASTEEVDFSEEEWQEYAWLVFGMTEWNNGVNINFTLGNEGIAFATDVDNYADFVGAFENKLEVTLKALDKKEAEGKSTGVKHTYKWVEYEKVISCILYSMLIRDTKSSLQGNVYTFDSNTASVSLLDITKEMIKYMDENQKEMAEAATDFYLCESIKDLLIEELGYTEDNCKNALWKELGKMYFGVSYIDTFDEFVVEIVKKLTESDGSVIEVNIEDATGTITYIFDPYAQKDSITGFLNYIQLNSVALDYSYLNNSKKSFFEDIVTRDEFNTLLSYYLEYVTNRFNGFTEEYRNVLSSILKERQNGNSYYIHALDYQNTKGLQDIMGEQYFNYGFSNDIIATPGSYDGSEESFGDFWLDNYQSARIVNHTINGLTGEIIDN